MFIALAVLALLGATGVAATIRELMRDGYRRQPVQATSPTASKAWS